jgi:hypothetical protein
MLPAYSLPNWWNRARSTNIEDRRYEDPRLDKERELENTLQLLENIQKPVLEIVPRRPPPDRRINPGFDYQTSRDVKSSRRKPIVRRYLNK